VPKYTIHNLPLPLKPFVFLYGWIVGIGFILLNFIFRSLVKIEFVGGEHVNNTPNFIFTLWHENLPLYFIAHSRFSRPHSWLSFPYWYMKPVHIMKKLIGIKDIAYGASGIDGKKALKQVVTKLQEGYSTFLNLDGPKGPAHVMKDGALVMSLKTGVPIIPLGFQLEKSWRLPSWDGKRYPPFFKTLKVVYGEPIWVTADNFELSRTQVAAKMHDVEGEVSGVDDLPRV